MKSQVMKAAWAIAKEAAAKHGGSSKQYISMAMQQAWAQVQAPVEEVAAVEVEVAVVEAAVVETKGFGYWMTGNSAGRTKGTKVVRKTETAAEKKARRAANPEMYASKPKRTTKAKTGADIAAEYTRGLVQVSMGQ